MLKLFYSATSPFVRKVVVAVRERGLADRLEFVPVTVVPTERNAGLAPENPLMKIPTLVLEDGETLFDSRVILEYLDSLHDRTPLIPPMGPARWRALKIHTIADGLLEAGVLVRYETFFRPEHLRWPAWIDGQMLKVRQALAALEAESLSPTDPIGIAEIAVGCALGYLDFRYPDEDWRSRHPGLAAFDSVFAERASMTTTRPPLG